MKVLLTTALALLSLPAAAQQEGETKPEYLGHALLFQVDLEHGRAAGWIAAGREDAEVLAEIAERMTLRLRRSGRAPEAFAVVEEEARISVTFVGPPPPSHGAMLSAGLSNPGRLDFRLVARAGDVAALGSTLAAEHERLQAWRSAHADLPLFAFNRVPRAAGGPLAELAWYLPRVRGEAAAPPAPRAVLRPAADRPGFGVRDFESVRPSRGTSESLSLAYALKEERREAFRAFTAAHAGRRLAVVLNDHIDGVLELEEPLTGVGALPIQLGIEELRELVFALDGRPYAAPVRFTGIGQRPLQNVARVPPLEDPRDGDR